MSSSAPWLDAPESLPDIPGGWRDQQFVIAGKPHTLMLPAAPDAFLEDRRVIEDNKRDDYMPYWAYVWPASLKMAEFMHRRELSAAERSAVLEFGCGVGLVGLGILAAGGDVIFSDYRPEPVQAAMFNARRNGYESCRGIVHDWRTPFPFACSRLAACDVLYETHHHQPIVEFVKRTLTDDGECWIADPGREKAQAFVTFAPAHGLAVEVMNEYAAPQEIFGHGEFQILRITKRNTR